MSDRRRRRIAGVIALALCVCADATFVRAQDAKPAERLARTKSASCTFPLMATVNWDKAGTPAASQKPASLEVAFDAVNTDEGSARLVGSIGAMDIIVRLANGTLHFVQSFREGPLYTTTIFPVEAAGGRLLAVHTRHEFTTVQVPGYTWRPEQYYGTCAIAP